MTLMEKTDLEKYRDFKELERYIGSEIHLGAINWKHGVGDNEYSNENMIDCIRDKCISIEKGLKGEEWSGDNELKKYLAGILYHVRTMAYLNKIRFSQLTECLHEMLSSKE